MTLPPKSELRNILLECAFVWLTNYRSEHEQRTGTLGRKPRTPSNNNNNSMYNGYTITPLNDKPYSPYGVYSGTPAELEYGTVVLPRNLEEFSHLDYGVVGPNDHMDYGVMGHNDRLDYGVVGPNDRLDYGVVGPNDRLDYGVVGPNGHLDYGSDMVDEVLEDGRGMGDEDGRVGVSDVSSSTLPMFNSSLRGSTSNLHLFNSSLRGSMASINSKKKNITQV